MKNASQNSSYEKKDNKIVTSYRTAKSGRNRNGFLLIKYENIISQTEWPMWHIVTWWIKVLKQVYKLRKNGY